MLRFQYSAGKMIWQSRWDILRIAIVFRILEAFLFTPLSSVTGQLLSGRAVIDSTDIIGFVFSPRGFVATFLWATLLLLIRLIEQAGLTAILLGSSIGNRVTPLSALRIVARRMTLLLAIAAWLLAASLAISAPLITVAGLLAHSLMAQHDINYYLAQHPPEFLRALVILAAVAIPTIAAAVWLTVRWRLVIPVALCEQTNARKVLQSAARWARCRWWQIATAWLITELIILALGLLSSWLGSLFLSGSYFLTGDGGRTDFLIAFGLLACRALVTGLVTLPGTCLSAGVFAAIYHNLAAIADSQTNPLRELSEPGPHQTRALIVGGWLLALSPVMLAAIAGINLVMSIDEIDAAHRTAVTAHRGGTMRSMENTLAAIREAREDGADYAEIDVQMSRDEILVVTHDSDFSRQAGVARKVWELTYDEIRAIQLAPAGSSLPADTVPTFDELLDEARGKIRLNIELKYYGDHQPRLAERVVEAVRAHGMTDQVIIQSLHYAGLMDVRRAAPEIPIGYLFSINAREPERLDVDFLSVQIGRANGSFVKAAHRQGREVHVWTVDKPADMERLINLGVDNLITNRSQTALEFVQAYQKLSPAERAARRIRTWLSE